VTQVENWVRDDVLWWFLPFCRGTCIVHSYRWSCTFRTWA